MTRFVPYSPLLMLSMLACDGTPTEVPPDPSGEPLLLVAPNDPADAVLQDPADYDYYAGAQFTMDDVLGDHAGVRVIDDPSIVCTSGCEDQTFEDEGVVMYPVDNAFGFMVSDFEDAEESDRDGLYDDGFVGTVRDGQGATMGVAVSTVDTKGFHVPANMGTWCAGLNGDPVKCSTEHFVTMENLKTCAETVPWMNADIETGAPLPGFETCEPLEDDFDKPVEDLLPSETSLDQIAVGSDYSISLKDDGKLLYRWGDYIKRPTDMRLTLQLPLPEAWTADDTVYQVTRAELAIVHTIGNSPNDQIRPEDHENEGATGRIPAYDVDAEGRWVSTQDCWSGDGVFLPTGTVFRNPTFADPDALSEDLQDGFTPAWFRTLDREPFAWDTANGDSPRWRLKAPKMGQDLPGFEVPIENCQRPPLQNGEKKYEKGDLTTTTLDLLDFGEEDSPLGLSTGWLEATDQVMAGDDLTANGVVLTENFDLSVYVKGEKKPVHLYSAHLYLDFEPVQE